MARKTPEEMVVALPMIAVNEDLAPVLEYVSVSSRYTIQYSEDVPRRR